ncbi:DUF72 domain-containing protein [Streptomyces sp. HNM1019]|uniref:DUF72 domain-containing protein n=1 Tax=Streptomyces sp. HNM1019 TaxID=3424717 RepID=UPI003D779E71
MTQNLPTSLPPATLVTSPRLAVARFQGRNDAWRTGAKEERFRYTYATEELAVWIPRLHATAEQADEVNALFSTCCESCSNGAAAPDSPWPSRPTDLFRPLQRDHCHGAAFGGVRPHIYEDPALSVWADGGVCWHLPQGAPGGGLGKWGHTDPLVSGELVIQTSFLVPVTRART